MRRLKTIKDVVDWGLCIGCGACSYYCPENAVTLRNFDSVGIRPVFREEICRDCTEDCISVCPGRLLQGDARAAGKCSDAELIGPYLEIWEGHASDAEIRHAASSGGALSAMALYCLEKEGMPFALHIGMNPSDPMQNTTRQSRTREDLIANTGSRYAPASPCDGLGLIEASNAPCVFIGKPCDAAAAGLARKKRPALDRNLGLVLTFFCAGAPSTRGTRDLLQKLGAPESGIGSLRYRGEGWPGHFRARFGNDDGEVSLPYLESWHFLQKYRSFRCNICPDGLGELGDISCGDAWHRYSDDGGDPGRSLILARTERGRELLNRARDAGYLELQPSTSANVIAAQGLVERRKEIFGRILAMKLLLIPAPRYEGMPLFKAWSRLGPGMKLKTVLGTMRRLLQRGFWHRNPPR